MTEIRPLLRYFGSKWRIAEWITGLLPRHICYVEPFGGSAAVLLTKAPSNHEVYNDIDGDVVNFFRVMRLRTAELVAAIAMTPYSRSEHLLSFEDSDDDLEAARRFYVRSWQTRGGVTRHARGHSWRYCIQSPNWTAPPVQWKRHLDNLFVVADRLSDCYIEQSDWRKILSRFDAPTTCFYLDPPYVIGSRSRSVRSYENEFSDDDHIELLEIVQGLDGMVVLSGYEHPMYSEALEHKGWELYRTTQRTQSNSVAVECLWLSPAAVARRDDLPLFARAT